MAEPTLDAASNQVQQIHPYEIEADPTHHGHQRAAWRVNRRSDSPTVNVYYFLSDRELRVARSRVPGVRQQAGCGSTETTSQDFALALGQGCRICAGRLRPGNETAR